jgi:hypothetical protein
VCGAKNEMKSRHGIDAELTKYTKL